MKTDIKTIDDKPEILEQDDYSTDDYLYKVEEKYNPLIGMFLLRFSALEHSLNIAIAEIVHSRTHELGMVVIENLTTRNKIELYYKLYVRLVTMMQPKLKRQLLEIKLRLEAANTFRNKIVHADWLTLTKEGSVRTKIAVDNSEGYVMFKRAIILPKTVREQIAEVEKLTLKIEDFSEKVLQF